MLQSFLMVLREGFESFLIVAIILSYLRATGQQRLSSAVYAAIGISLLVSACLGWVLMRGVNQALWEGILGLVTIVMVGSLVVHMWRVGPRLAQNIRGKIRDYSSRGSRIAAYAGVFLFTVLMITREGMETALMLLQVRDGGVIGGILLGLAGAALVAWLWAHYSHLINVKRFFQITGVFLLLFMIQVALYSFHEFSEAGVLPNSEALHVATESFSPVGRYGQWFSPLMVSACAFWLLAAQITDRLRYQKT
jgi:high-affinity iron transporter